MALRGRYAALALLAGGGLLFEIALTRVLSVLWFDDFVYVVLSIAVLGIGLGAALATAAPALRKPARLPVWFALAGLTAMAVVPALIGLAATGDRLVSYAIVVVPYAFVGMAIASLFAADAEGSPRLYLADLAGAGLGGALAAGALDALGGTGAAFAAAAALAAGSPLVARQRGAAWTAALAPGLALVALVASVSAGWPDIAWERIATPKPITEQLAAGATVRDTRWDALARTDLVTRPGGGRFLYMDGGAGSIVPDLNAAATWARDVGAFAFEAVRPDSAYLLGSGGGLDIALARRAGVEELVAAEVNRGSVAFSRALEPGLYGSPLTLHVDEGRSVLRRSGRFDLILLSQTVTQNAELHGLALTENALYTVEAFRTYLDHLTPSGAVAFKLYDELTLTRAITTAIAALADGPRTQADAVRHLFAVLDPRADPPVPLLLVRSAPFSRDEAVAYARTAEGMGFRLLLVPGLLEPPPLDRIAAGAASLAAMIEGSSDANLAPPTDARPFFWQFEPGVPRSLRPLLWGLGAALAVVMALYAARWRTFRTTVRIGVPAALLLGAGFMLAEIALLQRVQLLIGRPTLALGASLGTLLVAAGVGSALSSRWPRPLRVAAVAAALVAVALGLAEAAWPGVGAVAGAWPTAFRLVAALVPVAIVALPMGAPFPHLLRALGRSPAGDPAAAAHVAGAWALNGFASVIGAVGATALAVVAGFPAVAAAAVACYVLASLAFAWGDRAD